MEVRVEDTGDPAVPMTRIDGPTRSVLVVAPGLLSATSVALLGTLLVGMHTPSQCQHRVVIPAQQQKTRELPGDAAGQV